MKIYYASFLFVLLAIVKPASADGNDSLILVDLYSNMDGNNWKDNSNWLVNPINSWYGVKAYDISGVSSVYELNLTNNNLNGTLNKSLGELSSLASLDLSFNNITGNIPSDLGKLSSISWLDLSNNNITGTIPDSLGQLSSLSFLNLSYNNMTGRPPAALEKLDQLESLSLSHNKFSGTIPVEWSILFRLLGYDLSYNEFSGDIPLLGGEETSSIDVSHNHFSNGAGFLLDFFSGRKGAAQADISSNNLNFDVEPVVQKVKVMSDQGHGFSLIYYPQAKIPIHYNQEKLSVSAGGTLTNNTYNWYKNGILDSTIKGDSTYTAVEAASYYVIVENTIATKLKLKSDTIKIVVLPISNVLNFNCAKKYSDIIVSWETFHEDDRSAFNIQKSIDGVHFINIASMKSKASSDDGLTSYSYTDNIDGLVNTTKILYRLEIVHGDGSKEFGNVISISIKTGKNGLHLYPNPATNRINLHFEHYPAKNITVRIFDLAGKRVKEASLLNELVQSLSIKELNPGLYTVVVYEELKVIHETKLLVK